MLIAAAFLVVGAGLDLFLFAEHTSTLFAWAIDPPLTAAFLGANYLASGVVEIGAARQATWARARVAIPAVMLFTVLTAVLTVVNLLSFDLSNPLAWVWLVVYFGVPPILGWVWGRQTQRPGADEPRQAPLPAALRLSVICVGALMLLLGLALLTAPSWAEAAWPWNLSPDFEGYGAGTSAMAQYAGVWLVAWGTLLLHASVENDLRRTRYVFLALLVLGVLQALAACRFATVDSSGLRYGAAYGLALLAVSALGAWGLVVARRHD